MAAYTINFKPIGRKGKCRDSDSILACARRLGIGISSVCGGRGTCHTCRVQVKSGTMSEPTPLETDALSAQELGKGWRLACQATPISNCQIVLPVESMSASQRIHIEGLDITATPEPAVKAYHLQLTEPSLTDQQADADRLLSALTEKYQLPWCKIDIQVLRSLSPKIRAWNWECQASISNNEIIALHPWPSRQLGLAIDLGTTTIAGYLVDLSNGKTLASQGVINPQVSYGEDVISRIDTVAKRPDEGMRMQKLVVDKLNELAVDLCSMAGANTDEIVEAVLVGNTAMHHLLLGLPVRQLALTPFTAAVKQSLDVKARDLGLDITPGAYLHFPPLIAGFVGADHVAMLLATDSHQAEGLTIYLDIGTNTEISLVNGDQITATSCASGPAFEGGHIKHGIRATEGAIERLQITGDSVQYQTIADAPPTGICGSGALDALAQLYIAGVIDNSGRFTNNHPLLRVIDGQAEFLLVEQEEPGGHRSIVITQKDIRALQLAKAAIRAGIQLLLEVNSYTEEQVSRFIIAGAFGSYINLSSAITVGLLPPLPPDYFHQVGNAAGVGTKLALISRSKREVAQAIASRIRYIELASTPDFKKTFIETCQIGRYWIKRGRKEVLN